MSGPYKTAADWNRETQQHLNNMDILHRQYLDREARDNAWRSSTPTAPTYTSYEGNNWHDRRAVTAQERKDSIKEARHYRLRNEELKKENEAMHKELQDLRHEVNELKNGLEIFEQSNDVYKAASSKKSHIITDLCGQVSDLEDENTRLNEKFSEQVEEIAALKAQLQAKKVFEDIQVEREQRKLKEKEILQFLKLKAAPAPQRKRRPIGIVTE